MRSGEVEERRLVREERHAHVDAFERRGRNDAEASAAQLLERVSHDRRRGRIRPRPAVPASEIPGERREANVILRINRSRASGVGFEHRGALKHEEYQRLHGW